MRAAGYFRVSTEDQVEGWSLDAQKKSFEEFCQAKGWQIASFYADEGKSAWTDSIAKRPGFRRMLEDARANKFDVVVTHTLDRFSRNLWVVLDSFRALSASNVTFVSIQEQIDYTKPEGRLFLTMLGAFAQYFSDALSGHTRKGLKARAQNGLYNGEPPFGYERCTEDCQGQPGHPGCHVVEEKAELVKQLFLKYSEGSTSLSRLAAWLNDLGIRTNISECYVEKAGLSTRDSLKSPQNMIAKSALGIGGPTLCSQQGCCRWSAIRSAPNWSGKMSLY